MLWRAELNARPIDTPERRADLERRLMAQAGLIADRSVQGEYRRFLRDRLFQLGRPAQPATGRLAGRATGRFSGRGAGAPPSLGHEAPPPPGSPGRRNRLLFLAILTAYPSLIEDWVEEIAAIDLPEPELDSLRRAILEIAHSNPGLDAEGLRQHLALCGHAEILSALTITVARHAGFAARGGDDLEVIRLGLTETLQLLRAHRPSERETVARAFGADASDENWQRLKALKDREAQDGPVGGFE
jgi:DNA primase